MSNVVDREFLADLALALYQSSRDKQFTDFKIKAGATAVFCHRVVICVKSEYFESICKSGIHEAILDYAVLTEEDGQILRGIIQYMYLGKTNITSQNVEAMLLQQDLSNYIC